MSESLALKLINLRSDAIWRNWKLFMEDEQEIEDNNIFGMEIDYINALTHSVFIWNFVSLLPKLAEKNICL